MMMLANSTGPYEVPEIHLSDNQTVASPIIWWIVLIIVLLALAAIVSVAVALWCVSHGGGVVLQFTENFPYVSIGCSK